MQSSFTPEELGELARRAFKPRGSGARFAKLLGIRKEALTFWKRRGVPPAKVLLVSNFTGIPPHELRPDIWIPPINSEVA